MKKTALSLLMTPVITLVLMATFLPDGVAQQSPSPEPSGSSAAFEGPDGESWPSVPVKRYTMLSRDGEIAWQMAGGVAVASVSTFYVQFLLRFNQRDPYTPGDLALMSGASMITGAAAVYGFGRMNASDARVVGVALGALAGAGLNMAASQVVIASDLSAQDIVHLSTSTLLPVVGAVVGYQLTSTWRTGEAEHRDSSAAMWYMMPTRRGVSGGVGFVF